MMREVTGAFCGPRKLDEALEDLRAEGIAGDRIRVACVERVADIQMSIALSASSPTQWITAEHAGYAAYFDDSSHDADSAAGILPDLRDRDDACDTDSMGAITRVIVRIRDESELRAVCDIFSRLGTDDIDADSAAI
ncbi:hypothetical protein P9239_20220 [Caballeronia sp. LZ062]|uniref:hypothetical protein n=1 Tax=unclassified Caballeronia TaxID=2646786 RepID=UPI00285FADBC|nr:MULTISPECIES: hypothetical protein [unclassified Caballeronia]MDR5856002.1 hypothetical protein [Caballeronia sp. LZ050]MDR5872672.1 hypothetical protein [Caballeronia sp. LZ062]